MNLQGLMIPTFTVLLIIGTTLTGGCAPGETETPSQEAPAQIIEDITPQEAFTLIQDNQTNPDFVILDVRTPEEFAHGYIENALNIDFYSKTFQDEVDNLDRNKTYLIYCRSGNRSGQALALMEKLNFREVYNISDGIIGWQAEKLPTTK